MSGAAAGYRRIYSVVSRIPRGRVAGHDEAVQWMRLERRRRGRTGGPPAKAAARQPLVREPESLAVVTEDAQRRLASIPEHEQRAAERVGRKDLPTDAREAVDALPKILRVDRHQNPHLRGDLNHASAPASIRLRCARSASAMLVSWRRTVARGP